MLWIACSILAALVVVLWRWQVENHRLAVLTAALQLGKDPLVIFDERGRIIFVSPGLVVFDRRTARKLSGQFPRPERGEEDHGEVIIDGNRYLYRSKLLEYKPGRNGIVVYLDYRGSAAAN